MEFSNTDEQMCDACERQEKDPEVLQAAAILKQLSKDGRLTPTALDPFHANESTHVEYFRDANPEPSRKRKASDPRTFMKSRDMAFQSECDRPMAIPQGRIHMLRSSESESASSQGTTVEFNIDI